MLRETLARLPSAGEGPVASEGVPGRPLVGGAPARDRLKSRFLPRLRAALRGRLGLRVAPRLVLCPPPGKLAAPGENRDARGSGCGAGAGRLRGAAEDRSRASDAGKELIPKRGCLGGPVGGGRPSSNLRAGAPGNRPPFRGVFAPSPKPWTRLRRPEGCSGCRAGRLSSFAAGPRLPTFCPVAVRSYDGVENNFVALCHPRSILGIAVCLGCPLMTCVLVFT